MAVEIERVNLQAEHFFRPKFWRYSILLRALFPDCVSSAAAQLAHSVNLRLSECVIDQQRLC
jgi:hypothetical protein